MIHEIILFCAGVFLGAVATTFTLSLMIVSRERR